MQKRVLYIGVGISAIIAASILFSRGTASIDQSKYQIETAKVESGDVARLVAASGAVRALTTVEVGSQVSGLIIELLVDFNSEVTENQIIAKIDPQTFESRVASAQADVDSARANLQVQQASIDRAVANLQKYEKDFDRQTELYKENAIALSTLEDTERQLNVAKADLAVAKAQLTSSRAALSQRLASLQSAELDLERCIIRSPINGVVIERSVDVGQTVAASFSAPVLFQIANDLSDIRIDAAVVEGDIGGIDAGDPVTFKVDAYPDRTFEGVVEQVRLASETLQNVVTYTVVIAAKNPKNILLPGMTANVEITAEKRENVLRLAETTTRFRPPTNGPEVLDASDSRPRKEGNNPATQLINSLEISSSRKDKIAQLIGAEFEQARQSASNRGPGPGNDRNAMRQQMQAKIDNILKSELSDEEYKSFKDNQNARSDQKMVELYQLADNTSLQKSKILIGLSDGKYVEVLRGADIGDEFISRLTVRTSEK
ncbi:efflux RND transporter periplasmic adaptor subunit [Hirschia litorea]|uniref:Efflux RND transporter periplasmic adaptor subunit n=1 Tax=Hirschia litorea TaxID=1199156 RepID=A0ABW2IHS2_9PROT